MTTVSTAEAAETLPELMLRAHSEKVAIRSEDGELVYLVPSDDMERERLARIESFNAICRLASEELRRSLEADGLTVEEFMADVMKDLE